MTATSKMLYMVVERFKEGAAPQIYRRFREKGRMMPDGLEYVSSWIDHDFKICWQLMKTEDFALFDRWIDTVGNAVSVPWEANRSAYRFVRAIRVIRGSALVQRDAGAHPSVVDVEIDTHHFALAHPHQIVHENRVPIIFRPDEHHADFCF